VGAGDRDFDWKLNIKVNEQVDCLDLYNVWYNSTVLQKDV